jgi:hypothetical protein
MSDHLLREHILDLLRGGNAHISLEDFIKDFPADLCGKQVPGLPYTAWQVLEHMQLAQWDILEFSRDPNHVSPEWPKGYWPEPEELGTAEQWQESIEKFRSGLKEFEDLIGNDASQLYVKIPHGSGQTLLREALLVADHNAYHLGVLVVIGRLLGDGR